MHDERIGPFIEVITPLVGALATSLIRSMGCQVHQTGSGAGTILSIKAENRELVFFLENLLLEIATVDRDAQPLVFDENVLNPETFLQKTFHILESRLAILFSFLTEKDVEAAIDSISQKASEYERICIVRVDHPSF